MRKWYHLDLFTKTGVKKFCSHLRGERIEHEVIEFPDDPDKKRIRVLILDPRMLDDINRWINTVELH